MSIYYPDWWNIPHKVVCDKCKHEKLYNVGSSEECWNALGVDGWVNKHWCTLCPDCKKEKFVLNKDNEQDKIKQDIILYLKLNPNATLLDIIEKVSARFNGYDYWQILKGVIGLQKDGLIE